MSDRSSAKRSISTGDYPIGVSHRPLVLVSGLTLGDYALWNWSLGGGNAVLAIISGLTLVPLVVTTAWLFALNLARLLARSARVRPHSRLAGRPAPRRRRTTGEVQANLTALRASALRGEAVEDGAQTAVATASSDKLAA